MAGIGLAGGITGMADLDGVLAAAAADAARRLAQQNGFEARAAETAVCARHGRYTLRVQNGVRQAPSGNREKLLDLYAAMVVGNLLEGGEPGT